MFLDEFMSADAHHKTRALWLVGALHAFTHLYHVALLPLYLLSYSSQPWEGFQCIIISIVTHRKMI